MLWFAIWLVLVLAAAGVLFVIARSVWRKLKALTRELGVAADRLGEISERLASVEHAGSATPRDVRSP